VAVAARLTFPLAYCSHQSSPNRWYVGSIISATSVSSHRSNGTHGAMIEPYSFPGRRGTQGLGVALTQLARMQTSGSFPMSCLLTSDFSWDKYKCTYLDARLCIRTPTALFCRCPLVLAPFLHPFSTKGQTRQAIIFFMGHRSLTCFCSSKLFLRSTHGSLHYEIIAPVPRGLGIILTRSLESTYVKYLF
jgi:hypothetical protein